MVPLGIITAIIGAIRVSGPPWARAFIGRARETRATAELELLSSTSREVCEVFNGRGVVRTLGTPKLTQLIIFPGICLHDDSTCGIHTLQSAYESQPSMLDKGDFGIKSSWDSEKMPKTDNTKIAGGTAGTVKKKSTFTSRVSAGQSEPVNHDPEKGEVPVNPIHEGTTDDNIGRVRESSESPPTSVREFPPELKGAAPNLQLNLPMTSPSHRKSLEELWWAAAVALVIQMAVTIISAVTTFHGPTRKTVGRPQAEYWFWFFIGGTVCLNLSMMLCSWIIEKRTREYVWRANSETKIDYISDKTAKYNSAEELIKENQEAKATGTATTEQLTFSPYHASAEMELKYKNETSGSPSSWRQMKLFWLQQKHTVNDQDFDAFLILGGNKIEILTSSIPPTDASKQFPPWMHRIATEKFELLAILAALFGMAGFILQFEGLRGLAWPTAVAQLVAILFMALVRAVVRRRLGTPLSTIPATAGHELDWLSLRLVFDDAPLASHRDADDSETATLVPQWRISTHDILEAELPGAKDTTRDATGDTTDQPDTEKSKLPQRHLARRGKLEKRKRQSNENRSKRPTVTVPDQIDDTIADEADNIESRKKATKTHQRDRHGPLPQSFARLRGNDLARPLFPQSSEMLLKVRRRLGELTKCRGTASKEAIALSQAISLTLAELCPLQKDEIGTFTWSFDAIMTKIPLRQAKIYRGEDGHKFKEKRVDTGTSANLANVFDTIFDEIQLQADFDGYGWKIPPPDLDAILSLWMSHDSFSTPDTEDPLENWKPPGAPTNKSRVGLTPNLRSKSSDVRSDWLTKLASETVKYRRILGENPPHYNPEGSSSDDNTSMRTDILTRDLNWWTSDSRIVSMDTGHWTGVNTDEESLALSSTGAVKVAIGFNGLEPQGESAAEYSRSR